MAKAKCPHVLQAALDELNTLHLGALLGRLGEMARELPREKIYSLMADLDRLSLDDGEAVQGMTDAIARTVGKAT